MVNENQIAFIICINDDGYCEECKKYINDLSVPDGYEVDIITVKEAPSMTAGYNAAMNSSYAKYKVYIHQDVFIMNRRFIYDILDTFKDKSIGMIGVIGCVEIVPDADYLRAWHVGKVEGYNGNNYYISELYQNEDKTAVEVTAIDGMLMVTQYDVIWREEFDAFDYYDISQSIEMKKAGYRIVVPYQEEVWAYHDMRVNRLERYDIYRRKIIDLYTGVFDSVNVETKHQRNDENNTYNLLQRDMLKLISMNRYDELVNISDEIREMYPRDTVIREINNLMEIYKEEEKNGTKHSAWFGYADWYKMYEEYRKLQFLTLRIGYNKKDDRLVEYRQKFQDETISIEALIKVANSILPGIAQLIREIFIY